jgi:hypothetical protein
MTSLGVPLVLAMVASAGFSYEQVTQSRYGTKPRGEAVRTRVHVLGRSLRLESIDANEAGPALVLRLDEGRAFRLDPARKIATRLDLHRLRVQSYLDLSTAGEALAGADEGSVRTTPLEGSRVLAGRTCRGFRLTGPGASLDLYVADLGPGLGVDAYADFLEWSGASLALGRLLDEIRQLPGFPLQVLLRAIVHGEEVTTVTTVTKIERGPLAPALFEVPAGYAVVDEPKEAPEE